MTVVLEIVVLSVGDRTKKFGLNKVADFNDIVETDYGQVHFDEQDSVWQPYDFQKKRKISKVTKWKPKYAPSSTYHGIRNRESQEEVSEEGVFRDDVDRLRPSNFDSRNLGREGGYFFVKQRGHSTSTHDTAETKATSVRSTVSGHSNSEGNLPFYRIN